MPFRDKKWYSILKTGTLLIGLMIFILVWKYYASSIQGDASIVDKDAVQSNVARENKGLYLKDPPNAMESLYVTLYSDPTNKADLDSLLAASGSGKALEVYFSEKSEAPNALQDANATIEFKKKSKNESQKSYKLRLFTKTGQWNGQSVVNLNKYDNDPLRVRNKLAFDMLSDIPDMFSTRTKFIKLFVRDKDDNPVLGYKDYGLFIHTEQINKDYLQARSLESSGNLYEAVNFNFEWHSDLRVKTDPNYSTDRFSSLLDSKGSDDHTQLLEFVDAVNDQNKNIDSIVEKYLEMDNYMSWIASSILMGHYTGSDRDYYLYRPSNDSKWYHIPWDYDKSWAVSNQSHSFKKGAYIFWDNMLYRRIFSEEKYIKALEERVESLHKIISKEKANDLLERYRSVVFGSFSVVPDYKYLGMPYEVFKKDYEKLADVPEQNYRIFKESLKCPKPFLMMSPMGKSGNMTFAWDEAESPLGNEVHYTLEVAKDPSFNQVIIRKEAIDDLTLTLNSVPIGNLFWRVTAIDSKGNEQGAMNILETPYGQNYYGVSTVEVR